MLKKFFSFVGALSLICFSFYYTDSAVDIVKRNDPIMKQIKSVVANYEQDSKDAVLINNNIIPGVNGIKVDIDKSYEKMKKYGSFDESLLVFEEVSPVITTNNNYDKFIVGGNGNEQKISLIFKLNTTSYIDTILDNLKNKNVKVTFFVNQDLLDNDVDILEKIYLNGHELELLDKEYNPRDVKKINKNVKALIGEKLKYCYSESDNQELINNCKKNKMHSIIPNIITSSFPYNDIKNTVTSGSIISVNNDINTIRELSSILNYLNQKGYKMFLLSDLLKE